MIDLTVPPSLDEMERGLRDVVNRIHYDHQLALQRAIEPYTRQLCKIANIRNPSFKLIEIDGGLRQFFDRKGERRAGPERRKAR